MDENGKRRAAYLRARVEKLANKLSVNRKTLFWYSLLAITIVAIDCSFFFHTFEPIFVDEYGNYSIGTFLNNLFKSLLPLALIVPFKFLWERITAHARGDIWATREASEASGARLFDALVWIIMFAGAALAVVLLVMAGQITFSSAALNYMSVSPDVNFDPLREPQADTEEGTRIARFVEEMSLLFVATSFSAAVCWAEISRLQRQQSFSAYLREVVATCDEYLCLSDAITARTSALEYIASDRFLYDSISKAHADLHDTCLTALHRVKGLIEKCTDPTKVSDGDLLDPTTRQLGEDIILEDRDGWLARVDEAEVDLARLEFFLPTIRMSQRGEPHIVDIKATRKEQNNG